MGAGWGFVVFFEGGYVAGDRGGGDLEVPGDLIVGEAIGEALGHGVAFGVGEDGGAAGAAFSVSFEPGGDFDFVAVKQAAGDDGDDVVPGVGVGPAHLGAELVAFGAGEGGMELGGFFGDVGFKVVAKVEVHERADGEEDGSAGLLAGGAAPSPAPEAWKLALGQVGSEGGGVAGDFKQGRGNVWVGRAFAVERRDAQKCLLEVVGKEVDQRFPEVAPDRLGGLKLVGATVEGDLAVEAFNERDSAVGTVLVLEAANAVKPALTALDGFADAMGEDAEALGEDFQLGAGEIGTERTAEFAEEVPGDDHAMGEAALGVGVMRFDTDVLERESAVVGAESDGPFAEGTVKLGLGPAREALAEEIGVGIEAGADGGPGIEEGFG